MNILLFTPALNESATVATVITAAQKELECKFPGAHITTLVIDDGSQDTTFETARSAGATVIKHTTTRGLGFSFQEAVDYAIKMQVDYLVTIDADGQFDSIDPARALSYLQQNNLDFVSGSRFLETSQRTAMPRIKVWGNHLVALIISRITAQSITDATCGLRAYSREALWSLNITSHFTYTHEAILSLAMQNKKLGEIPIAVQYFSTRVSRIAASVLRYGWRTWQIIINSLVSYHPLQLFGGIALFFSTLSLPVITVLGIRFILTGNLSPHKGIGLVSLFGLLLAFIALVIGLVLQTQSRQQRTLDRLLYLAKRQQS